MVEGEEEKERKRKRERREEKRRNNGASFKYLWGNSTRRLGGGEDKQASPKQRPIVVAQVPIELHRSH